MLPAYGAPAKKTVSNQQGEAVQRRAVMLATGEYQHTSIVTAMLQQLKWQTLQSRRAYVQTVLMDRDHMGSRLHINHRYQI